jgi:predicted anti-sigma-YlaC factor YlaD
MTCEEYLNDPEGNAAHLESCEICRAIEDDLGEPVAVAPRVLDVEALPLAPWEGASHRTWPLVAAGLVATLTLLIVLSAAAGVSPVDALSSSLPSVQALLTFLQLTGRAIGAPLVAVLFVVINTVLFVLLRRAPKGVDV